MGASPNPGILPYLAETFLAAGFTQVNLVRVAVGGSTTAQVRSARLGTLTQLLVTLGLTPDLVITLTGTNDSNSEAEANAFALEMPKLCNDIERSWAARIIIVSPSVQPADKTHSDEVRAHCAATALAKSSRGLIAGIAADLTGDAVHLALLGDERIGELVHPVLLTVA